MDVAFSSAVSLAEQTRSGAVGCQELLDRYIDRVERLNPRINAVVVRDFERARQRARWLDNQTDRSAPLFGVPMTVKESFDVAGLPSTRGHLAAKAVLAPRSSIAIRRLEAAGAVIFGKTNVPVDLADWQSYNPVYGATTNPWNTAHTPGGSSGGSAASLAAGLCGLELGTDIGGSVRVPAHFCGLFGHKPTWGLCPNYADPSRSYASTMDLASLGPMARSAADLAVALDVLAGPDPDETGLTWTLPAARISGLKGLRVALWTQQAGQATDAETVAALENLGGFLERSGAVVSRTARPDFDPDAAYQLYLKMLAAAWSLAVTDEGLAAIRDRLKDHDPADPSADGVMLREVDRSHRDWLRLNEARFRYRRVWSAFFKEWDVLLCPAFATSALPLMQEGKTWTRRIAIDGRDMAYNDMLFWPGITIGFHLPATVAPIGLTRTGLPLGVQIAGPLYGDHTTIVLAGLLEKEYRAFQPPPGW